VVSIDRIHVELSKGRDRASAEPIREHMRQLRRVLAGSRYQIVNYRSLGYELIVADASRLGAARGVITVRRLDWWGEPASGSVNHLCISLAQRSPVIDAVPPGLW
jgi:hypothetical protein